LIWRKAQKVASRRQEKDTGWNLSARVRLCPLCQGLSAPAGSGRGTETVRIWDDADRNWHCQARIL